MSDLKATLLKLAERGTPVGTERLRERVTLELAGPTRRTAPGWTSARWRVAVAAAAVVLVVIGGTALLLGGAGGSIAPLPPVATDPIPITTGPPVAEAGGVLTVDVSSLSGSLGDDLAGVLLAWAYDPASPDAYRWDGVGGFAVTVDSDPFSTSQVLGEVEEAAPSDPNRGMWPWASGEAKIPAGNYTLWLWAGKNLCCYNRWVPADSYGLQACELRISTTGQDQTIHITDFPSREGPCVTDPDTAVTGTIRLSADGLLGMEGYRLLAGVWSETADPPLVGGAFWTLIDSDPFTDSDLVHPPAYPNPRSEVSEVEGWGAEDYLWNQTAQLEPGTYQVTFWANPGELAPYGSHIPRGFERTCSIDVEVVAGTTTTVIVTEIPLQGEPCQLASD